MKTTDIDPLIPRHETGDETLTRLSANIGTLTGLMNDAERAGHHSLAEMFNRARDVKVAQAAGPIALATAGRDASANDRRFLLMRDPAPVGVGQVLPRQRFPRSPDHLALSR